MKRLVIITVGKTHSGKTTFARALEQELSNSLVIDQDNHAEFINTYYKPLLPKQGPNTIKYAISKTIVDYAICHTNFHLVLCNSNRSRQDRLTLLEHFHRKGFMSIIVNFDIPDPILQTRISESQRPTTVFRSATTFEEVLIRQEADSSNPDVMPPTDGESVHLFVIKKSEDVQSVIRSIVDISHNL